MKIRAKTLLLVLPLLISTLIANGVVSSLSAGSGLTRIAMRFLGYKAEELNRYLDSQWDLLVANGLAADPVYVDVAKNSALSFARTMVKTDTERVTAFDESGSVVVSTDAVSPSEEERGFIRALRDGGESGWVEYTMEGSSRVGHGFAFEPFDWYLIVSEARSTFYGEVSAIMVQSGIILATSCLIAVFLLVIFSSYLTGPLERLVGAMRAVTETRDLSRRVEEEYDDEIGRAAHQFNVMTADLEKKYIRNRELSLNEIWRRKQVEQREKETLFVLGKASDVRDPETGAHIIRVGLYSRMLARLLNEDEVSQDLIYNAAPLHDVGKIGIPDHILLKPAKLDPQEMRIMKTHTSVGYEILKRTQSAYLRAGATIALTHHERYDGTGYPNALAGNSIPLYGRIVCLIDVFDALTSKRPYKEAWSFERAVDVIREQQGTYFDPVIVELFLASLDTVHRIYAANQEEDEAMIGTATDGERKAQGEG